MPSTIIVSPSTYETSHSIQPRSPLTTHMFFRRKLHITTHNELIKYLNDRGYNHSFLKKKLQRVHAITRNETLKPSQTTTNQPSRVPLVITYNPSLRSISSIIQKHYKILSSSPRCNDIFQTTPLVAFRRTDNLSDILVRSKLRTDKTN